MYRTAFLPLALFLVLLPFSVGRAGVLRFQETTPTPQDPTETALPAPYIASPLPGEALQGTFSILGSTAVEGFQSAELSFTYSGEASGTWFLIQEMEQPLSGDTLSQWDTTTITDGAYDLQLVVTLQNGETRSHTTRGLRVRNYTPIETNTPTPVTPTATPEPGDTPVPTQTPTPTITPIPATGTPLPPNPATFTNQDILRGMGQGGLIILGLFALMGIYYSVGRLRRKG